MAVIYVVARRGIHRRDILAAFISLETAQKAAREAIKKEYDDWNTYEVIICPIGEMPTNFDYQNKDGDTYGKNVVWEVLRVRLRRGKPDDYQYSEKAYLDT